MATPTHARPRPRSRRKAVPTIVDVAAAASVSAMTVSRVINGETGVADATRDAVREAIAQLNYAPNRAARNLAGGGQFRVGLFFTNPSAAYLFEFLLGGLDQAAKLDIQLVVEKCEMDQHVMDRVAHLVDSDVDGVILTPPLSDSKPVLDLLIRRRVPTVVVATGNPPPEVGAVSIDDHAAARQMTLHLTALGHSRIGFISGDPMVSTSMARLAGYRAALMEVGIEPDDRLVAQGQFTYRSGLDAADELLDLAEPPTAIFASNDDMAAATVASAHRRDLDVPGDLSVCGFDDTAIATTIWPELTTIRQPIANMCKAAVEALAAAARARKGGRAEMQHMVLDYSLIRRQSDAAPRRRRRSKT